MTRWGKLHKQPVGVYLIPGLITELYLNAQDFPPILIKSLDLNLDVFLGAYKHVNVLS